LTPKIELSMSFALRGCNKRGEKKLEKDMKENKRKLEHRPRKLPDTRRGRHLIIP